jgi:DNA-directed RNA polymerase subunit RPC12/RpoP
MCAYEVKSKKNKKELYCPKCNACPEMMFEGRKCIKVADRSYFAGGYFCTECGRELTEKIFQLRLGL